MPIEIAGIKLYTIDELQEPFTKAGLPLSRLTLRAYAKSGRIEARKIGNRWLVSEESLRKFFKAETGHEPKDGQHERIQ